VKSLTVNWNFESRHIALFLLGASWLVFGAFFASDGLYTSDDIIYIAMIDRIATAGSLFLENGYDVYPAQSLLLVQFLPGDNGLVSQYPHGFAILAAPFYMLAGIKGIMFLNTLSSVLTLYLTFRIAKVLFRDEGLALNAALIFGLATFAAEYAFGIWPHAAGSLFVAGGVYGAVMSLREGQDWRWAALAGLVIGIGVTIRADVAIAAPVLFVWMFVNARRPATTVASFVVALGLGLCMAAWLNYLKFGLFAPITYGRSEGNTSLSSYMAYIPYALLGGIMFMGLRWRRVQQWMSQKRGWISLIIAAIVVLLLPYTRELVHDVARGLYVLIVNLEGMPGVDTNPYTQKMADGFYLYWGRLKKTLVQNIPYLGLLVFSLAGMFRGDRRSAHALCLLLPVFWFLPFAAQVWIGGQASNMRYFSPILPLLAISAAAAWAEVIPRRKMRFWVMSAGALLASLGLMWIWSSRVQSVGFVEAFFVLGGANWFALALLIVSVAWLALPKLRQTLGAPIQIGILSGFFLAFMAGYPFDVRHAQRTKDVVREQAGNLTYIEHNAHLLAPGWFSTYFQLLRPQATLAFPTVDALDEDIRFIEKTLHQGRPVYIASVDLARLVRKAVQVEGIAYGPGGFVIERSISPVDGKHYDLYLVRSVAAE
jgi:4-amino-4-deoxy-L-arabinose transferase-like glycosyltransferase